MSMKRQLALSVALLMVTVMAGNLVMNIYSLRHHVEQQMAARADETATTLALTLTHFASREDDASLASAIDVVFDRGHYLDIGFTYLDGRVIQRTAPSLETDVPLWFKKWLPMTAGYAETFVNQGWSQLGTLSVQMHTAPAFEQMWRQVKAEVAWFALMTFIMVYGLRIMLVWHLKPLKQVVDVAEAMANNQFQKITQEPKGSELRVLVRSMNRLSDRLHSSFLAHAETVARLQQESDQDSLTQLHNRKGWEHFLQDWMKQDTFSSGWVMLVCLEELSQLNQTFGRTKVDELLLQLAMQIKTEPLLNQEHVFCSRVGGEFWLFVPDPLDRQYEGRVQQVLNALESSSQLRELEGRLRSVVLPVPRMIAPASLKHQLDMLMSRARLQQQSFLLGEIEAHTVTNWVQWQQKLNTALSDNQLKLFYQPCVDLHDNVIQWEVHCRLHEKNGAQHMAAFFWPMVETLKMAVIFDQWIIRRWQEHQAEHPAIEWVINISNASLQDAGFRSWFEETLTESQLSHLVMECSEYALVNSSEAIVHWLNRMVYKGMKLGVDHMGTYGSHFGYLARIPVYQGKIEKRFIRDIAQHDDHAFFVSGMTKVLHSQQALCFAEGVETEDERQRLKEIGVDGMMGFAISKPQPL